MDDLSYLKKYYEGDIDLAKKKLEEGIPVQYIVGDVDFCGLSIKVNPDVLIPRFETELLVIKTSEYIKKYLDLKPHILDIGTGSGCIAIALKKTFAESIVSASDISREALEVAKLNATLNQTDINFINSDIFSHIKGKYDVIISNPPYIATDDEVMEIVKNNEPHHALYAKDNGYYFYDHILKEAKNYLNDKYIIAFEIGNKQGLRLIDMANTYFKDATVILENDLNNENRYLFIIKS